MVLMSYTTAFLVLVIALYFSAPTYRHVNHIDVSLQGYTHRYTYNQLQVRPDNGKHR